MPQTHVVKPGETLWRIAQKYLGSGSRWKEIGGYSGRPEGLPAGTSLTIPTESPTERAVEMTKQLRGGEEIAPEPTIETKLGTFGAGEYNVGKIQTDLGTASTEKKKAYEEMIGLQASLYEDEYSKAGLGDTKTKIETVDQDIANRKAQRDQMILDEKGKPIPQWMITGRKKLEVEQATADLNQLIDQRNSLASQYNKGIENVTRKVGYGLQDATAKYGYWEGEEKRLTGLMGTYQTLLAQELGREEAGERWEKEFGLEEKLYELQKQKAATGGGAKEYAFKPIYKKDMFGNTTDEVVGYFDPSTGQTVYYTPEEGGSEGGGETEPTEGFKWYTESDVRTVVNEALDEMSAEQVKSSFANIGISDSSKSVDKIVDEEWSKRQPKKWWQFWK